uniref:Inhibitor I9 domain-containing protein n=1 Tax=Setaria italica TaxID=4555 RepID=K3XPC8_SETIT
MNVWQIWSHGPFRAAEAKGALIYHYSGVGFAARLAPEHAARLS